VGQKSKGTVSEHLEGGTKKIDGRNPPVPRIEEISRKEGVSNLRRIMRKKRVSLEKLQRDQARGRHPLREKVV